MKKRKVLAVLGVAVRKGSMPHVYRLARVDAGMLELVLRGIMRKRGYARPQQAMRLLETDLGYGNTAPKT